MRGKFPFNPFLDGNQVISLQNLDRCLLFETSSPVVAPAALTLILRMTLKNSFVLLVVRNFANLSNYLKLKIDNLARFYLAADLN